MTSGRPSCGQLIIIGQELFRVCPATTKRGGYPRHGQFVKVRRFGSDLIDQAAHNLELARTVILKDYIEKKAPELVCCLNKVTAPP